MDKYNLNPLETYTSYPYVVIKCQSCENVFFAKLWAKNGHCDHCQIVIDVLKKVLC
jgi:hypothetical protein